MGTESLDIVVTKSGADEAAASITGIGAAGDKAAEGVNATNASLNFMKDTVANTVPPIQQMNTQLAVQEGLLRAAQSAADRAHISLDEYNQRTQNFINGTQQATAATEQATGATDKHTDSTEKHTHATNELSEATNILKEVLTALGLLLTVDKILEEAEAFEKLEVQIRSVSTTAGGFEDTLHQLEAISNTTGTSLTANARAFQDLTIETQGMNISQKDLLTTLAGVNAAVQRSGGTSTEAAQAINVLTRALATGEVQGRQLRTVLLEFPELGQLIATGLNVPVSALTSFSQKSALASKDFIDGFNRAATAATAAAGTIQLTLGQSLTVLGNNITAWVGEMNNATGATSTLANAVQFLAQHFDTIMTGVRIATTVFASFYGVMVTLPFIIGAVSAAFETLSAAILANPIGALVGTLVAVTALVYQFGNSIQLTSDGSITLLGALIGSWNVLKAVMTSVWTFVTTLLGPAFSVLGTIISTSFTFAVQVVRGFLDILQLFIPSLAPLNEALGALASPLTTFKTIMVDAMTEATTKLNETTEATGKLGAAIGDGSPPALGTAAKNTANSINTLNAATQTWKDSMGLVHPVLTDLYDAQTRFDDAVKKSIEDGKAWEAEVDQIAQKTEALALTTRNAFGDMVAASDEWALRSGENFNKVAGAQQQASSSASSGGSVAGGSGDTSTSSGALSSGYGRFGNDFDSFLQSGQLPLGDTWTQLLTEASSIQDPYTRAALTERLQGAAKAAGAPGFKTGGDFTVGGSGGPDSQLVQFYATPGESVSVRTPTQQNGGRQIVVNMNVTTPDAGSFKRSQRQTLQTLAGQLAGVQNRI